MYCLRPISQWSYCGGGAVIIANSFEEACEIIKKEDCEFYIYEKDPEEEIECPFYKWFIVEILETNEKQSRMIFLDYNWG